MSRSSLPRSSSFLFGYSIADAVEECEEEGKVDGSGDFGSVFEVERCKLGDDAFDGSVWREEAQLGLRCHLDAPARVSPAGLEMRRMWGSLLVLHRDEDLDSFMSGCWQVASHRASSIEEFLGFCSSEKLCCIVFGVQVEFLLWHAHFEVLLPLGCQGLFSFTCFKHHQLNDSFKTRRI